MAAGRVAVGNSRTWSAHAVSIGSTQMHAARTLESASVNVFDHPRTLFWDARDLDELTEMALTAKTPRFP